MQRSHGNISESCNAKYVLSKFRAADCVYYYVYNYHNLYNFVVYTYKKTLDNLTSSANLRVQTKIILE